MRAARKKTTERAPKAPRPDANRIALRAARSILEAAAPVDVELAGTKVRASVVRLPGPAWPARGVPGLSEAEDGPWPSAVRLDCSWPDGRAELVMSAAMKRGRAPLVRSVGLRVSTVAGDQSLMWISIPQAIRGGADGARVWVPSPLCVRDQRSIDRRASATRATSRAPTYPPAEALRGAALRSGLLLASARHIEAFAVRLPEGEVLPLPGDAFARVVHLSLLLLPFAAMTRSGLFEGEAPFDVDALPGAGLVEAKEDRKESGPRLARIYPLPGGVRRYKATLDTWLDWIGDAHPSVLVFRDSVRERYGDAGHAAADEALRLLEITRLASPRGGVLELTEAGEAYRVDPAPSRLFDRMSSSFEGLFEVLVLAATPGIRGPAQSRRLLEGLLERRWRTPSQVRLRRSWLLSMGLVERVGDMDRITAAGLRVLSERSAEAAEIRRRIEDLLEEELEEDLAKADAAAGFDDEIERTDADADARMDTDADTRTGADTGTRTGDRRERNAQGDIDNVDDVDQLDQPHQPPASEPPSEPPERWSEPVDLTADKLRPYLNGLRFPDSLLHRVCAAISSGKHLLLVGPPGTGKTELAVAIGAAARAEGFCRDLLTATASADWTTFDTIGGYAIQRAGAVRFRPGIFLRTLERRGWLLIDELNRADIDRAFGELLTVLAGRSAATPFALDDGRLVTIGPDPGCSHRVPPSFRLLATMNTWDRTSLFRLSYAALRRFATIDIGAPDDATFEAILREAAGLDGSEGDSEPANDADPPLDPRSMETMKKLFSLSGVLTHRPIGPAIAVDMIRYLRRRRAGGDAFVEAASMILLAQLEGLEPLQAEKVYALLTSIIKGWASPAAAADLRARFRDLFPLAKLSEP